MTLAVFLGQVIVVSLSGVMAPGAVTAVTLGHGARRPHAGALVALGHGVVEFPLMGALLLGVGALLQQPAARIGIGLTGGVFLLVTAAGMLRASRQTPEQLQSAPTRRGPLLAGVVLTAGNPYFLVWWATVGLALATQAAGLGIAAFVVFAVVHWLCDLVWLEVLSLGSYHGTNILGPRSQRYILVGCGLALLALGGWFLFDAGQKLLAAG